MPVAVGTRDRTNQAEMEGMAAMLKEVLHKLETFDTRLEALEGSAQSRLERGIGYGEEEGEFMRRSIRRTEIIGERVMRQTKVDFSSFDGNRVHK